MDAHAQQHQQRRRRAAAPLVITTSLGLSLALAYAIARTPTARTHLMHLVLLDFAMQAAGWAWSAAHHSEHYFDATGAATYITLTCAAFLPSVLLAPVRLLLVDLVLARVLPASLLSALALDATSLAAFDKGSTTLFSSRVATNVRALVLGALVLVWAARLGTLLYTRIQGHGGRDKRFDDIRDDPVRLASVWSLQGLWVFVVGSSAFLAITEAWSTDNSASSSSSSSSLGLVEWIGVAMWIFGFAFEALADEQKRQFQRDASNRGRFIQNGLWYYSRHPNYFGEILMWTGLFVFNVPTLHAHQHWTVFSPLLTAVLLLFVSGVPMLEASSDKKWGDEAAYKQYKASTPVLVPNPFKR